MNDGLENLFNCLPVQRAAVILLRVSEYSVFPVKVAHGNSEYTLNTAYRGDALHPLV
jgi:hypothetical protein